MPDPAKYDLAIRPDSSWEAGDALTAILVNVKGTRRRQMIRGEATDWANRMVALRRGETAPQPSGQARGGHRA